MSDIAKLYDDVMNNAQEKTAADAAANDVAEDTGPEFNAEFFDKVASGDEESAGILNSFIEQAREEGHSDEEIESAIADAMKAAGVEASDEQADGVDNDQGESVEDEEIDEFEQAKAAAYMEGVNQALADVLESDLAKEAGVTAEDLIDYELGGVYAQGYAESRMAYDEVVEKIATHKKEAGAKMDAAKAGAKKLMQGAKEVAGKGAAKAKAGGARYKQLMTGSNLGATGLGTATPAGKAEARKILATRLGTGAVGAGTLGGAGYGVHKMRKKKDS